MREKQAGRERGLGQERDMQERQKQGEIHGERLTRKEGGKQDIDTQGAV